MLFFTLTSRSCTWIRSIFWFFLVLVFYIYIFLSNYQIKKIKGYQNTAYLCFLWILRTVSEVYKSLALLSSHISAISLYFIFIMDFLLHFLLSSLENSRLHTVIRSPALKQVRDNQSPCEPSKKGEQNSMLIQFWDIFLIFRLHFFIKRIMTPIKWACLLCIDTGRPSGDLLLCNLPLFAF